MIQRVLILWGDLVEFLIVKTIGEDDRQLMRGQQITCQVAPGQLIPGSALIAGQLIPGSADLVPGSADPKVSSSQVSRCQDS